MLRISLQRGVNLSTLFLGIYFVLLPFDFYKVAGFGSISRLAAVLPIGLMILELIHENNRIKFRLNKITKSIILFLIVTAVSVMLSISFSTSMGAYNTLLLNMVMIILLGATREYRNQEVIFLEKCLVLCGWLTAILMLSFSRFSINRMLFSIGDNTQDPNYMCGFMMYAFCFHLQSFMDRKKINDIIFAVGMIILVIMSGSRGALLSFTIAAIASVIFAGEIARSKKVNYIGGIFILLIGVLFLYQIVLPRINTAITERFTLAYLMKYGTVGRFDIWNYLLSKYKSSGIIRKLIGFGYGTTIIVNDMPGTGKWHVAHNLYIDNLVSAGLMGLFAQVIFQISCFKTAKKTNNIALCTYIGYLSMCLSLSLTSYKPMWALVLMLLIYERELKDEHKI